MTKVEPTRLYLRQANGGFSRLLWMQNSRPNELLLGAYSLAGKPAFMTHDIPEKRWSVGEPPQMNLRWSDATRVTHPVDHFTFHADGRFHAKCRGRPPYYTHIERAPRRIDADSPVFLRLLIISDVVSKYKTIEGTPKLPHVWIEVDGSTTVALHAMFAGVRYPLEAEALLFAAHSQRQNVGVHLASGTIQGYIYGGSFPMSPECVATHPGGTILMFQWFRGERTVGAKMFVMN